MAAFDQVGAFPAAPAPSDGEPRHRIGAVARMLRMPVATLRTWESRFGMGGRAVAPNGHRLYSAVDVRRLALIKQLTDVGHSIGTIAALDTARLQHLAMTHATAVTGGRQAVSSIQPLRVVAVGDALVRRLVRPAWTRRFSHSVALVGRFSALSDVAPAAGSVSAESQAQALLVHAPTVQEHTLAMLQAAAAQAGTRQLGLLYSYATAPVLESLQTAGVALIREPVSDAELALWISGMSQSTRHAIEAPVPAWCNDEAGGTAFIRSNRSPRRYDDATLADIAHLSSTIACECPRHVAELLLQLSHFESYSEQCASAGSDDTELHAYLRDTAGTARTLFEHALRRIAMREGLILPS